MIRPFPITLVLVSYNKASEIGLAIESAATGSMKPDLLVISDDGSDDGTPETAVATAARFDIPCHVTRHPRVGVYRIQAMRNTCVTNALEGVVYLSDSDCIFGPHTIETHFEIHCRHELALGTGPRFEFLEGASGRFTSTFSTLEFAHFPGATHCVPVGANLSFRKSLWRELGGFDRAFDGAYGMEEFEFNARALRLGASAVSDPGAYVFHIPHETVFGARSPLRNLHVFDRKYGVDHLAEERYFVGNRVTPWYWRGGRKQPILGDRVVLDEWGAPSGFVPPLHLQLSRTLQPVIDIVRDALATEAPQQHQPLRRLAAFTIDNLMLAQTSPASAYITDLQWVLEHVTSPADVRRRLERWHEGATGVERVMAQRRTAEMPQDRPSAIPGKPVRSAS